MIAMTENPAIMDPAKTLTKTQKDALASIDFFKLHRRPFASNRWQIGTKEFSIITINRLLDHGLVRPATNGRGLKLTMAGSLALDRLKGITP